MDERAVKRVVVAAALAAASFFFAAGARGDGTPPERVAIVLPTCADAPLDVSAITPIVQRELHLDGVREVLPLAKDDEWAAFVARLEVSLETCAPGSTTLTLSTSDAVSGSRSERALDLSSVPRAARARLVALSLAELLRASWMEVASPSHPVAAASAPSMTTTTSVSDRDAAGPPASSDRPSATPPLRALASTRVRALPLADTTLLGGEIGIDVPASDRVRFAFSGGAMATRAMHTLGAAWVGIGYGAAAVHLLAGSDAVGLHVGPRAELGAGWASGSANAGAAASTGAELVATVVLEAIGRAELSRAVALFGGFEAGAVVRGFEARADGRSIAGVSGATLGAVFGVALVIR
jgi:hypothetical protein